MRPFFVPLFLGLLFVTSSAVADPTVPVPTNQRIDIIDDNVYENPALAGPPLTRRFEFTQKTKNSTTSDGSTTKTEEIYRFEILGVDSRVITSRMFWDNENSSGSATNHATLNGLIGLRNQGDTDDEASSLTILSAEGSLWPLKEGAKMTVMGDYDPTWADEDYLTKDVYEVTGRYPASFVHPEFTGDAIRITVKTQWRYKHNRVLSSNSVGNHVLIENLGYAFNLDHDYNSEDSDYESYSSYEITDFEFLDR